MTAHKLLSILFLVLSCTFYALGQNPASTKWELGIRGGTDYTSSKYFDQNFYSSSPNTSGPLVRNTSFGLNGGLYLNKYLSDKWSLRSEIGFGQHVKSNYIASNYLSAAIFPRYRFNKHLDFEAGIEARKFVGYDSKGENASRIWLGTALHLGKIELNLRYAPGFQSSTDQSKGGMNHSLQMGTSVPLLRKKS